MAILRQGMSLTFDDVLIRPSVSDISSRSNVDLTQDLGKINLNIPVISSCMDTVTEIDMAIAMAKLGGFGILHRFVDAHIQAKWVEAILPHAVGAAIGVGEKEADRLEMLLASGCNIICVDVANGQNMNAVRMIKYIKDNYPDTYVIGGNVATAEGMKLQQDHGADMVRVGIGGGAFCTTRVASGIGISQLSSIMECAEVAQVPIIADGGIRKGGDVAKAIAAGANVVMLGGLLVGTDESPGDVYEKGHYPPQKFKYGRGMASPEAMAAAGKVKDPYDIGEGIAADVPYVGPTAKVIANLMMGLKSSMSYVGANTIKDFQDRAEFIQVSNASMVEAQPHILKY